MGNIAIQVEGLGKRYEIGAARERYATLRDRLAGAARYPVRLLRGANGRRARESFWALKDVSFEVRHGEVVGIIGRNGAGKSTLLKILSRITEPTEGFAELHGRVGSLLEVGTGFHPELSGRENIFLNGAILGMRKQEIESKFDEIVEFAEVEKFIDTPVKHYSSGMYLRLAFAVAAHLEPEILLVDEVLAVGDAAFQRKCLGKMGDVARAGRTVLFVSHNMAAVQRLCHSAILLNRGGVEACGEVGAITEAYLQQAGSASLSWHREAASDSDACFESVYLADERGEPLDFVTTGMALSLVMEIDVRRPDRNLQASIDVTDANGDILFASAPQDAGMNLPDKPGRYRVRVELPDVLLAKTYGVSATLWVPRAGRLDYVEGLRFTVHETDSWNSQIPGGRAGRLAVQCGWKIEQMVDAPSPYEVNLQI